MHKSNNKIRRKTYLYKNTSLQITKTQYLMRHDQLVIDNIVGCVTHPKQSGCWMKMARHTSSEIYIFSNAFKSSSLVEVGRTNTFTNYVPLSSGGNDNHFLRVHNVFQLAPNFSNLSHGLYMNKMFVAPCSRIAGYNEQKYKLLHNKLFKLKQALMNETLDS